MAFVDAIYVLLDERSVLNAHISFMVGFVDAIDAVGPVGPVGTVGTGHFLRQKTSINDYSKGNVSFLTCFERYITFAVQCKLPWGPSCYLLFVVSDSYPQPYLGCQI